MDTASQLIRLFDYDSWANEQLLLTVQENLSIDTADNIVELFAHIAGAQELWYRRIEGQSLDGLNVWPDYGLPVALQKLNTLSGRWKQLIDANRSNLDKETSYKNSKGTAYNSMLGDILHHLIIHGQHHRAQIATLLRRSEVAPPATDFIFYTRSTNS